MRRPLDGSPLITTQFKAKDTGSLGAHLGIDYRAGIGTSVFAPSNGVIKSVTTGAVGGKTIEMQDDEGRLHRFLHLSEQNVRAGQKVSMGQVIARTGNTGQVTGPHLHWDVRKGGTVWNASLDNYYNPEGLLGVKKETVKNGLTWYVRSLAGTSGRIVGVVSKGQSYATDVQPNGWRRITLANGITGFVAGSAW